VHRPAGIHFAFAAGLLSKRVLKVLSRHDTIKIDNNRTLAFGPTWEEREYFLLMSSSCALTFSVLLVREDRLLLPFARSFPSA
jgi:hypothetical protein